MRQNIRRRILLTCIGLAVGPQLAAGIVLAGLTRFASAPISLQTVLTVALIATAASACAAVLLGLWTTRRIVQPLQGMTEAAEAIATGDLAPRISAVSDDEVGILAGAFNHMCRVLRGRIGALERRSADQTKALAALREVSRLTAMLEERQLAAEVVEKVRDSFHYFQVQMYFLDAAGEHLILAGDSRGAAPGSQAGEHKVPKGRGPAGRAAESNAPVLVPDTASDRGGRPDPPPPKVKSELAVPLAVGDEVLGVLYVRQNIAYGLTQADIDLLQPIAGQVAAAVHCSRPPAGVPRPEESEEAADLIGRKIEQTATMEDALRTAAVELGRALNHREMRVVLFDLPDSGKADSRDGSGGGRLP
ncbi:MAG: GAF domain-containing protein [Anaerolineales bacterium]|nr:GAF domain-containing protein [Anaerolineales bacterium]